MHLRQLAQKPTNAGKVLAFDYAVNVEEYKHDLLPRLACAEKSWCCSKTKY
jgi:hypothetical protein